MRIFKTRARDEQVMELPTAETWEVRWQSRYGDFSSDLRPEIKVFLTEEDAERFANALRDAFSLIRHTSGTHVRVMRRVE